MILYIEMAIQKDGQPINLNDQDFFQAIEDIREFSLSLQKQINAI